MVSSLNIALTALISFLGTVTPASITFRNRSPSPVCYTVEYSRGSLPTNFICDSQPGLFINATQNVTLQPTPDFDGAITAMTMNGAKGARHEINYVTAPDGSGHTWYDIDYEMGISNSTLGPMDHRNRTNGRPSLAGERNCLAKANAAWVRLDDKSALLPHYYYLDHRATGNLSIIRMDKKAPFAVMEFFQMEANFTGYMGAGSVDGVVVNPDSREGKLVSVQDRESREVDTQDMVITAY